MKSHFVSDLEHRQKSDLLVLPFWEEKEAANFKSLKSFYFEALQTKDFKGKAGSGVLLYPISDKESRILLLGLGKEEKINAEVLRRAYANASRNGQTKNVGSISFVLPECKALSKEEVFEAVAEGALLSNYAFLSLKKSSLDESCPKLFKEVQWVGIDPKFQTILEKVEIISSGVHLARDLVNRNADDVNPKTLADLALDMQKQIPAIETKVFGKKELEKEKFGLILAVNRGSNLDPFLIQVSYKGNPGSEEHIVLVGKGVTYDTGGLNIKVGDGMLEMKCDMAGGAAVLAAVQTAAKLKLKTNVTALVASTENSVGSKSYKVGDVYSSYSGKTVEINNTDAEGRLVLADAISYAYKNLKPTFVIDLATLTGGVVIALGEEIAAFFSNNDELSQNLMEASEKTGEALWRMPLYLDYKEAFKSEFGDIKNSGGKEASSMKGAIFVHEFVEEKNWAHLDIAGVAFPKKSKYYHTGRATGFGVRVLIEYLEKRASK